MNAQQKYCGKHTSCSPDEQEASIRAIAKENRPRGKCTGVVHN